MDTLLSRLTHSGLIFWTMSNSLGDDWVKLAEAIRIYHPKLMTPARVKASKFDVSTSNGLPSGRARIYLEYLKQAGGVTIESLNKALSDINRSDLVIPAEAMIIS